MWILVPCKQATKLMVDCLDGRPVLHSGKWQAGSTIANHTRHDDLSQPTGTPQVLVFKTWFRVGRHKPLV